MVLITKDVLKNKFLETKFFQKTLRAKKNLTGFENLSGLLRRNPIFEKIGFLNSLKFITII